MSENNQGCCSCHEALDIRDHAKLKPCGCVMCAKCLLRALGLRRNSPLICCSCGVQVDGHEFVGAMEDDDGGGGDGNVTTYQHARDDAGGEEGEEITPANDDEDESSAEENDEADEEEEIEGGSASFDDGCAEEEEGPAEAVPQTSINNDAKRKRSGESGSSNKIVCRQEGCTSWARNGGVCIRHGAKEHKARYLIERRNKASQPRPPRKQQKRTCTVEGCDSWAKWKGVCQRHGAPKRKKKKCSHEGCSKNVLQGGVCGEHGAAKKICHVEGCSNQVVNHGVCLRHGAAYTACSHDGCNTKAVMNGVCIKHGAKTKVCSQEGCNSYAKIGGLCMRHYHAKEYKERYGIERKFCDVNGCSNRAQVGHDICCKHGAPMRLATCDQEGCENRAIRAGRCGKHSELKCSADGCANKAKYAGSGLCRRHGGVPKKRPKCSAEGCTHNAVRRGLCVSHGANGTILPFNTCIVEGCDIKTAVKHGKYCKTHTRKTRLCNHPGCNLKSQCRVGGFCSKHGDTKPERRLCTSDGCPNLAVRKGLCSSHCERIECSVEICTNKAARKGLCKRHGGQMQKKWNAEGCTNDAAKKATYIVEDQTGEQKRIAAAIAKAYAKERGLSEVDGKGDGLEWIKKATAVARAKAGYVKPAVARARAGPVKLAVARVKAGYVQPSTVHYLCTRVGCRELQLTEGLCRTHVCEMRFRMQNLTRDNMDAASKKPVATTTNIANSGIGSTREKTATERTAMLFPRTTYANHMPDAPTSDKTAFSGESNWLEV